MSEYYAVIRSTDHLAHYGVKGMKWGVRKAIARGNNKALSRQYQKAQKKLAKLNAAADIETQKNIAKKHNKRSKIALGVGLAGLGAFTGNELLARRLAKKAIVPNSAQNVNEIIQKSARKKRIVSGGKGIYKTGGPLGGGPVSDIDYTKAFNPSAAVSKPNAFKTVNKISSTVGMAGFGTAAYQKGRAIAAKYKTTKKGHAKAVAKRDAFKREMKKAFAGTEFNDKPYRRRKRKH